MDLTAFAGVASVAEVAGAYIQHYRRSTGDRAARLAAQADDWSVEFVYEAVERSDSDLLLLLDTLVEVPEADGRTWRTWGRVLSKTC